MVLKPSYLGSKTKLKDEKRKERIEEGKNVTKRKSDGLLTGLGLFHDAVESGGNLNERLEDTWEGKLCPQLLK
jgi:hypothetical protein